MTRSLKSQQPYQYHHETNTEHKMNIFHNSGALICLAGPTHLHKLNLNTNQLIPSQKIITAVGGYKLKCHGWVPVQFTNGTHTTNQSLYICDKVDWIYFSRQGCLETKILSPSFPYPMPETTSPELATWSTSQTPPTRPSQLLYHATPKNIPKLENYLLNKFSKIEFSRASPFPAMNSPPADIHIKPNAKPIAWHTPIPIPIHWKKIIKESLDHDVQLGIINPVPTGTPVEWCSPMVVTSKKDETPWKTVNLQHLNAQSLCEAHHT